MPKNLLNRELFYDEENDRIIYENTAPNESYWNSVWEESLSKKEVSKGNKFVTSMTEKYLKPGSKVLDAGCGTGATVFGLEKAGFKSYGIDFAATTVDRTLSLFPDLNISISDVRTTPFPDNSFDGVWSLGVIEHFPCGFDDIVRESWRIIKNEGYLFLTVPCISPLKRFKIRCRRYQKSSEIKENFFQFAFNHKHIKKSIEKIGFSCVNDFGVGGVFGVYEDLPACARLLGLNPVYKNLKQRIMWSLLDRLTTSFTYHTRFFAFQKAM